MVLVQIGDVWRRFCHKRECFPYILWRLCNAEGEALAALIEDFQRQASQCPSCIDAEFSSVLLSYIPKPFSLSNGERCKRAREVQLFLRDVAAFCPISTDATEALHGFAQSKLHRFRGNKPTDAVSKEITIWSKITSAFRLVREFVWHRTGDPQALRRLSRISAQKNRVDGWQQLRAMGYSSQEKKLKGKRLCGALSFFKNIC